MQEDVVERSLPVVREGQPSLLFDWTVFCRVGRLFAVTLLGGFVLAVVIGTCLPAAGDALLRALRHVHEASFSLVDRLLPTPFLVILVGNLKAALTASLLGLGAALALGYVQQWERRSASPRQYGWPGRLSYWVLAGCVAGGRWALAQVGEVSDLFAQTAAALAALVPPATVMVNGLLVGVYLAAALLRGWTEQLWLAISSLLPHGFFEIPAILLSATLGVLLAQSLVARLRSGRTSLPVAVQRCLRPRAVWQTLAVLVGLILVAAALEAVGLQ